LGIEVVRGSFAAYCFPTIDGAFDRRDAAEREPAVNIAAIAPDVWRELVRRRLSVAALSAVEARGLGCSMGVRGSRAWTSTGAAAMLVLLSLPLFDVARA
jgi:hypothetical protein